MGMLIICQRNVLDAIEMQMWIATSIKFDMLWLRSASSIRHRETPAFLFYIIFIEGIDSKDKFIVRQVAATQRRAISAGSRYTPGHTRILLHLI